MKIIFWMYFEEIFCNNLALYESTALLLKLQTIFLISMAAIWSSRRKCKLNPNVFCYICGSFTVSKQRQGIKEFVKKAYLVYFRVKFGDQYKNWAPHQVCRTCVENQVPRPSISNPAYTSLCFSFTFVYFLA